ncbi:MAG: methyltransferase domain-containing protein [Acidobacteriia bacterium]|nr:methyltransferase domain-containing protein [Terriglobia bacterium]
MDPALRHAWSEIVTAEDYEEHMASIGQAQAAAELSHHLIQSASLPAGSRITIAGAGTGQMFDLLDPAAFRPYHLTCTDLNPAFLARLRARLTRYGLDAEIVEDDIERTTLKPGPDLLLAALLLEHIDWRRGVEVFAGLRPGACAIILQENPPDVTSAVTPGRRLPPTIAQAVETAHPALVPRDRLIAAMAARGSACRESAIREVADGKRLIGLLFAGPG